MIDGPSCMCGNAAVVITGLNTTSQSRKNALQSRRNFMRRSFSASQSRCGMSVARAITASADLSFGSRLARAFRFASSTASVARALHPASSA